MSKHAWTGVFPAVTTQFRQDMSLDIEATSKHCEALIASGVSGLIMARCRGAHLSNTTQHRHAPRCHLYNFRYKSSFF